MKKNWLLLIILVLTIQGIAVAQNTNKKPPVKTSTKTETNNETPLIQTVLTDKPDSLKILSDKNAELYIRLAQISLKEKDYVSVIAYSDSALARDKSFIAYRLKGLGQFNLGMYKETILSMSLGIEKKESDFDLHYYRGLSYHLLDSIAYAEQISKDMLWAVTISPLDTMAYYYKGMANFNLSFSANYKKDDKLKECISDLVQFVKLKPNFIAHYTKGAANFLLGGSSDITSETEGQYYNEVIKDMTKCLEFQPGNENCLYYRGLSYFIISDFENAIKDAKELASKKKPDNEKTKAKGFFSKK